MSTSSSKITVYLLITSETHTTGTVHMLSRKKEYKRYKLESRHTDKCCMVYSIVHGNIKSCWAENKVFKLLEPLHPLKIYCSVVDLHSLSGPAAAASGELGWRDRLDPVQGSAAWFGNCCAFLPIEGRVIKAIMTCNFYS